MNKKSGQGPRFVRYLGPVIDALRDLGGSGSPEEVRAKVASILTISDAEQNEEMSSGAACGASRRRAAARR